MCTVLGYAMGRGQFSIAELSVVGQEGFEPP